MYRFDDEPNFASFARALKAGNPDAIVAFNPGVKVPVICHTKYDDYTAGEVNLPELSKAVETCPGRWLECEGRKAQFHILSFLGKTWCDGDRPQLPDEQIVAYTRQVTDKGGVMTYDVPIQKSGLIPEPFVEQLRAIGAAVVVKPAEPTSKPFVDGTFSWKASGPLILPNRRTADPAISIKDPTIVSDHDRWHLFCTVRMASGKVDIEYLSFADWKEANQVPRHPLNLHNQYYCAPQVFYFRPHRRWYLIYQIADKGHQPPFGPAYSTSTALGNPKSWSKPRWLFPEGSAKRQWIDFWVICDREKAHLFYTSNDGRMWRSETKLTEFPGGWSPPQLALQAEIFEASHTYRLRGSGKYLTIVEAQADQRRYYKAYLADQLEGPWTRSCRQPRKDLLPRFPMSCRTPPGRPTSATGSFSVAARTRRWRWTRPMSSSFSRVPAIPSTVVMLTARFRGGWASWK